MLWSRPCGWREADGTRARLTSPSPLGCTASGSAPSQTVSHAYFLQSLRTPGSGLSLGGSPPKQGEKTELTKQGLKSPLDAAGPTRTCACALSQPGLPVGPRPLLCPLLAPLPIRKPFLILVSLVSSPWVPCLPQEGSRAVGSWALPPQGGTPSRRQLELLWRPCLRSCSCSWPPGGAPRCLVLSSPRSPRGRRLCPVPTPGATVSLSVAWPLGPHLAPPASPGCLVCSWCSR